LAPPGLEIAIILDFCHRAGPASSRRRPILGVVAVIEVRASLLSCPVYLSPATTRTKAVRLRQVRKARRRFLSLKLRIFHEAKKFKTKTAAAAARRMTRC
jgi:hypothetical protein